ncbi:probable WRKY transcription factor 19 [Brachypodium distachyon]|uniref:probable WRKY transcription factor 19 n=1 Tax=Brachypodium distachyon TaxID=15368 RepID=UPI000D0CCAE4|nr:probable WRKY transcription factor 19 [Brachypodium distachyon]|eukprot:XP_024318525.1 probable WRKY transcription factor 19 [Brachypodium distachyon]
MAIGDRVGEAMQNIVSASDFEFCQGVSQDIVVVLPSAKDREKQVNASAAECNKQLSIVHTEGLQPMVMHDEHSGLSTMQNAGNGEVVTCKYQGCSKPSQGNTMHFEAPTGGSEGCMVQGCTKGALEDTPLCISHHSMLRKVCCAITGCTNIACTSSGGLTDCCVKHGGGKRCKYDSCGKGCAQGRTDFCVAHGGGRRCKLEGCGKSAPWRSDYCIEHGGGRCEFQGCSVSATRRTYFCSMHRKFLLSAISIRSKASGREGRAMEKKKLLFSDRREGSKKAEHQLLCRHH